MFFIGSRRDIRSDIEASNKVIEANCNGSSSTACVGKKEARKEHAARSEPRGTRICTSADRGRDGYKHIVQPIGPTRDMQTRSCAKLLPLPKHAKRPGNVWYISSAIYAADALELLSPRLQA
jgi:hypothetical protein